MSALEPLRLRDRAAAAALTYLLLGMWVVLVILLGLAVGGEGAGHHSVPTGVLVVAVVLAVGTSVPAARWLRPYVESVLWSHADGAPQVLATVRPAPEDDLPAQLAVRIARQLRLPYVAILGPGETAATGVDADRLTHLPLAFDGEPLGELGRRAARGRDRGLAGSDRAVLEEVAGQVAIVLHAVRAREEVERSRAALVSAREEERRRIRNDLHDGLGPTLASLGLHLAALERLIPTDPGGAVSMVEGLRGEVRSTSVALRELVYDLRPPVLDDVGLLEALRSRAVGLGRDGGPVVTVDAPAALPDLPAGVEVALYRIGSEALANVHRHAGATRARLCVAVAADEVRLVVEDDGAGLPDALVPGVGLASMRERAEELQGTLSLRAAARGSGTRLEVVLPLPGRRA